MVINVGLEDEGFLDGTGSQLAHLLLILSFIIKINLGDIVYPMKMGKLGGRAKGLWSRGWMRFSGLEANLGFLDASKRI